MVAAGIMINIIAMCGSITLPRVQQFCMDIKPEPNMLKILPIIPSSSSEKIYLLSYFILISLLILFPYYSFTLMFQIYIDI